MIHFRHFHSYFKAANDLHYKVSKEDTLLSTCAKTHVSDEKSSSSRLAKLEKTQFTYVNEYFSDKHNSLSRKSGKKLGFSRRNYL